MGERPTPDAPHTGRRCPPRVPSCRPHSAQSQLARARAAGLVTGPQTDTPCTHSQWVAGPGRTPQGRAVGLGRSPTPDAPHADGRRPLPGRPRDAQHAQSKLARARAVGLVAGPHADDLRTHSQRVAGPDGTPQGRAVGHWRAPNPRRPTCRQEVLPRAPSCRPHSVHSQLARVRAGVLVPGPHAHTPRTHSQWVTGPGRTFQGRAVRRG